MRTLVLADHNNHDLGGQTRNTITCAAVLGRVDVLVAGHNCAQVAKICAKIKGVETVLVVDDAQLAYAPSELLATLMVDLSIDYEAFLAPTTSTGKDVMPRVAALLDVQQISDILSVIDENTFTRPIFAGNAIQTLQSCDAKKVLTVRSTAFDAAPNTGVDADIKTMPMVVAPSFATFVRRDLTPLDRPDLTASSVVISGGRGMGSLENFALLERIADQLGAAIGASRAAVDAGFAPNAYQIGQTGKVVAPDLYIAVGISGAIQHLAGMKDSRIIVAINCDPDAPIFKVADYGLVADLRDVLPKLAQVLKQ
ncbi:MAG: electron transfer flavoprotein subunit alpha/FixB family protein [Magnetovibrio sp.]|nr:electron transfer flavoprotein subunit alpha/FixB family protein [Magnetovibrio sp.]